MPYDTVISAEQLLKLQINGARVVLLDCGFDLGNPAAGEAAYTAGHLSGAQYAHLDRDLSGSKTGSNGRHPLPSREALAARAGQWGIVPGVQVVVYDDQGSPYAARAWWLLRWLGHAEVAVLDGGRAAWLDRGGTLTQATEAATPCPPYPAMPAAMPTLNAEQLRARLPQLRSRSLILLDARVGERFRGEVEPLDPVAGHIPGATLRFFKDNLGPDGRFKPAAVLRAEFGALGATAGSVQQCGSGVTACHNLLAMAHAGLGISTLYPGSWSEWCSDPARPVEKG